jgi:hypothetical protein
MSKEEILNVACPKCRVAKGERCQTSGGREMPPSQSHNARIRVWGRMNASAEALAVKPELQEPKATVEVPEDSWTDSVGEPSGPAADRAAKLVREEKIQQVLWGVNFARNIMGMPQHQIDRNVAEMIVDGDLGFDLTE